MDPLQINARRKDLLVHVALHSPGAMGACALGFLILFGRFAWGGESCVSLGDLGGVGDGKTDNSPIFQKAFNAGAEVIRVPAGDFAVSGLVAPAGTTIEGCGARSTLKPTANTLGNLLRLSDGCTLAHIRLCGFGAKMRGIYASHADGIDVRDVTVEDFDGPAIDIDHVENMVVEGCAVTKAQRGINITFSQEIAIRNNIVKDCTDHGMEFWGNWKWQKREASDLQFSGNRVTNGGRGAIWGSGAERVLMSQNIVNGAEDVGLDLEWCTDSVIEGNIVIGAKNAGIALFFACEQVVIAGNTIAYSDPGSGPAQPGVSGSNRWKPSAIWLTDPNRSIFPQDKGHRNIAITGNSIRCNAPNRGGIWIGAESEQVALSGNAVGGGGIWHGRSGSEPDNLTGAAQDITIRNDSQSTNQ